MFEKKQLDNDYKGPGRPIFRALSLILRVKRVCVCVRRGSGWNEGQRRSQVGKLNIHPGERWASSVVKAERSEKG